MTQTGPRNAAFGLDKAGLANPGTVHWNSSPAQIYEQAVRRGEGQPAAPFVRQAAHGHGLVERFGPVVDARQQVRVQIDHRAATLLALPSSSSPYASSP